MNFELALKWKTRQKLKKSSHQTFPYCEVLLYFHSLDDLHRMIYFERHCTSDVAQTNFHLGATFVKRLEVARNFLSWKLSTVWSSELDTLLMRYEVNLTPYRIKSVPNSLDQTVFKIEKKHVVENVKKYENKTDKLIPEVSWFKISRNLTITYSKIQQHKRR